MDALTLEPIYGSYGMALSISLILIAVTLRFQPLVRNAFQRKWLVRLRFLACMVLVLAIFRPTLNFTSEQVTPTSLVFAADQSLSMTLSDGEGRTRERVQNEAWKQISTELEPLKPDLDLKLITYGDKVTEMKTNSASALETIQYDSASTDITGATQHALNMNRGVALSGVILIGDGNQTSTRDLEAMQLTLETLKGIGIPLWTIPIGRTSESGPPRDVSIDAVPEAMQLFAGNESSINFQVNAKSLTGIEIPVELSWIDSEGNEITFATRTVVPSSADDSVSLSVTFTAPAAGSYQMKISGKPAAGEIATSNNDQISFVDVREGGGKILYLDGTATMEQVFLRRALRRFPDLELDYKWIPEDTQTSWPIDLEQDLKAEKYDVFILGDLPATALGEFQLKQLSELVASGAGLLTLGGSNSYSSGNYQNTSLANVLPVELATPLTSTDNPNPRRDSGEQIAGPISVSPAQVHPIIDLGSSDINESWNRLPSLLGANRWEGTKNIPGVVTLLESETKEPLMVIGEYGEGRVSSVAFDSSWRWWRAGESATHRRFWRQTMLWLLSRENFSNKDLIIELDSRRIPQRFSEEEAAQFLITPANPNNQSFAEDLKVFVVETDGTRKSVSTEIEFRAKQPIVTGKIPPLEPGIYQLQAVAGTAEETSTITFQVSEKSIELTQPEADPDFLRQLSAATEKYGGQSFRPENISTLCDLIRKNHASSQIQVTSTFRLGEDPVSGWILFVIFTGSLACEWILRRRWGLA